jgi:hypothetical protein
MPALATVIFLLYYYNLSPQHVWAPAGHPHVEHNISHLSMGLSMPPALVFTVSFAVFEIMKRDLTNETRFAPSPTFPELLIYGVRLRRYATSR